MNGQVRQATFQSTGFTTKRGIIECKDITIGSEADCAIAQNIIHIVLCNFDGITITFFRQIDCHTHRVLVTWS